MQIDSNLLYLGGLPWIFFVLFVLIVFNGRRSPSSQKMRYLLVFSLLFACLRYGIGYDYYTYKLVVEGNVQDYQMERWNLFPRLLADICRQVHYQLFFVITSVLTILPVYYVCDKLSPNKVLSFAVFLLYPQFYLMGLGPIRNYVAFSMVMLFFYHWYFGRKSLAIICYLIAIEFHTSAIVAGIIFVLKIIPSRKSFHFFILIVSLIVSELLIPLLSNFSNLVGVGSQVTYYLDNAENYAGGGFYKIIVNAVALINILYWRRLSNISTLNQQCLILINIGACVWNILLPITPVFATRLAMFFLYFLILLSPTYGLAINRRNNSGRWTVVGFCLLLFVFTFAIQFYNYVNSGIRMSNYPYQFFFNHVDLYF